MTSLWSTLLVATLLTQAPAPTPAEAPRAHAAAQALGLGPVLDAVERGDTAYLALERGGIAVVSLPAPVRLVRRLEEGRRFVRLALSGDALVAVEVREEARAFSLAAPEAPRPASLAEALGGARPLVVAAPPPQQPAPVVMTPARPDAGDAATLTVAAVHNGEVTLGGPGVARLAPGAHVRVLPQGEGAAERASPVLGVERVVGGEAVAHLGRGEAAREGDVAEPTDAPRTARLLFPPSEPLELRFGVRLRPFLALGATTEAGNSARAGGVLADLFVDYRPQGWPVVLQAALEPVGVGLGTGQRHTPGLFRVGVAYSSDTFEAGLGAGALFGQPDCYQVPLDFSDPDGPTREVCENTTGATVHQTLRLGALDGLHIAWSSSIVSSEDQFEFGSGRGEVQVPLGTRLSLVAAGGGSGAGWGFGELGVRTFLQGTGGPGSLVLTAGAGFVTLSDGSGSALSGPSVTTGLEWRL